MNKIQCVLLALFLSACAGSEEERPDAVDDFIQVNELEEARMIPTLGPIDQDALVNDRYVIVKARKEAFLLAYYGPCPEPYDDEPRPDYRSDPRAIYAVVDTFRGCRIKAIYGISEAQAAELAELGRLPGER